jgi:4-amino-4-deoxy-L-arabinose transferase-like glycosyltransferase
VKREEPDSPPSVARDEQSSTNPIGQTPAARHFWRDPLIWALIGIGLVIRIGYNLALHSGEDLTSTFIIDEREYFGATHMLAEGRGFSFFDTALWVRPPLYVMILAGVVRLVGTSYLPVLLLQALLSAATLLPLGWLAWRIGGRGPARWAVGLGALFLPFTLFAGLLLSETLFTLLLALTLVALVRAREVLPSGLRKCAPWLLLSGILLGLSALTRATALGFVPLAALWLCTGRREAVSVKPTRIRILAASLMLSACLVTLIPWTVRNYIAYGKFVAIDTTGGYNLWLASVGVRDEERLQADYRAIPNQADRQSYAYGRAWENISADPMEFMGKGLKESLDLWKPQFASEERQVRAYTLGRAPSWHLLSLLLFDDFLYVVILCLSVLGLAFTPPHSLKWLTGLWVLLWVLISFIFFAVTRFRLPIVAALVPWAGIGANLLVTSRGRVMLLRRLSIPVKVVSTATLLAILFVTVPEIQASETFRGVERWGQQEGYRRGEVLLREGNVQGAISAYRTANQDITDTRYALAAAYIQGGQVQLALSILSAGEPPDRFEPAIIRGEAARQSGDLELARSFFNAREVNVAGDAALRWAWDHLSPPAVDAIELGSGLDIGYVRGFYGTERDQDGRTFRWSGAHPEIRGKNGAPNELRITWSGWRPTGLPLARPGIITSEGGRASMITAELPNAPSWTNTTIDLGTTGETSLKISVNSFIGAGNDPRLLGVRISKIEVSK